MNELVPLDKLDQRLAEITDPADAAQLARDFKGLKEVLGAQGDRHNANQAVLGYGKAARRAGELLAGIRRERGGDQRSRSVMTAYQDALGRAQLDHQTAHRWQGLSKVEREAWDQWCADVEEGRTDAALSALLQPRSPKAVPAPNSFMLEGGLLRFSPADLATPTVVALILRVLFPDATTALDVTYGSGMFWDGSAHVSVRAHDGDPTRAPDGVIDFRDLSRYGVGEFDVVLFDPPHLEDAGELSVMRARFGTYAHAELKTVICEGASEAWRVADLGIVVKVTDHVHAVADTWFRRQTGWVIEAIGQEPYDVVHQVRSNVFVDPKWQEQLSAYNNGSTYLIFRKGDQRHIRRAPE